MGACGTLAPLRTRMRALCSVPPYGTVRVHDYSTRTRTVHVPYSYSDFTYGTGTGRGLVGVWVRIYINMAIPKVVRVWQFTVRVHSCSTDASLPTWLQYSQYSQHPTVQYVGSTTVPPRRRRAAAGTHTRSVHWCIGVNITFYNGTREGALPRATRTY